MHFFKLAIKSYSKALGLLFSRKFWWFMFFPLIFFVSIFWGSNIFITHTTDFISEYIGNLVYNNKWLQTTNLDYLDSIINILLRVINFVIFIFWGGYIVLTFMSPIYSWLSEKVEEHLTGAVYEFRLTQLLKDIFRGIMIALRSSIMQFVVGFILFIFSFIPLFALVTPFIAFISTSYFYGFAFMDYAIERKQLNARESTRYIYNRKYLAIGIGSIFSLALMIPFLNIIVCSFVSLLSVIASVVAINEIDNQKTTQDQQP